MSKIPFLFRFIPDEFLVDEFLDDPIMMRYIRWMFKRLSPYPQKIRMKGKVVDLAPFEFIYGREACAEQAGISLKNAQTRTGQLAGQHFIEKVVSKSVSTFSVYRLVTTSFTQIGGQQVGQPTGQQSGHNQELRVKSKESLLPYPSSKISQSWEEEETEDFFLNSNQKQKNNPNQESLKESAQNEEKPRQTSRIKPRVPKNLIQHNIHNQTQTIDNKSNTVFSYLVNKEKKSITISHDDLEACIALKGTKEAVEYAIGYVLRSPGRKYEIYNWPETLARWDIKANIKSRVVENEEMAKRYEREFAEFTNHWRCRVSHNKIKDQRVLMFESESPYLQPFEIDLIDLEFRDKASKFVREKRMQKGRISLS